MSERLNGYEITNVIKSEVKNENVRDKINDVISRSNRKGDKKRMDKDSVMDVLRNEGVVDCIIQSLLAKTTENHQFMGKEKHFQSTLQAPGPGQFLCVTFINGSNLAEHLLADQVPDGNASGSRGLRTAFQFVLSYQKQRFTSRLIPCVRDPIIDQHFFIKVTDGAPDNTSMCSLMALREPVHLVLLRRDLLTQERILVSSQVLEWRTVLGGSDTELLVDLKGVLDESQLTVGRLHLLLRLVPENHRELPLSTEDVEAQLRATDASGGHRRFLAYAKGWWQQYRAAVGVVEGAVDRRVKIFAQDENCVNRMVCEYVRPMRAGRLLDSPCQAARFVASLPSAHHSGQSSGDSLTATDQWRSALAVLLENRGTSENHAVLLCSLLLGCGLNAFVAIGVVRDDGGGSGDTRRPHCWVVSFQEAHPTKATFWEPCTGKKSEFEAFPHYRRPAGLPFEYASIGCLFNDRRFLGNCHKNDAVPHTVFSLDSAARWLPMSEAEIARVTAVVESHRVPLCVSRLVAPPTDEDCADTSNDLERQLRAMVEATRSHTRWDDQLCYLLGQALFSYEQEQLCGVPNLGNEEFREAVQAHVREGHTFKAFPLHVLHTNAKAVLDTAMKSPVFREIVSCQGSDLSMAVRVRTFRYAEQATPTWVIFGCTYQFTNGL